MAGLCCFLMLAGFIAAMLTTGFPWLFMVGLVLTIICGGKKDYEQA